MYATSSKNEVVIKCVGKISMSFPEIDQLKIRDILEEVLFKYDVRTQETGLTVSDVEEKLQIYLIVKKLEGLAKKTLKNYEYNLIKFSSMLIMPLNSVTTMHLRLFLSQRCEKLAPSSKNEQIYILKSFFGWLNDEGYIQGDPAKKLKLTKEPIRLREALSEENMEIFRQTCTTDREKALISFIYSSACRLSDAVTINISNINWELRSAIVIGKGDKQREIYFSVHAKVLMKKYISSRKGDSDALFLTEKYPFNRLSGRSIERAVHKIQIRSGLNVNIFPHLFRHGRACELSNKNVPLQIIKEILGHESINTSLIYAKVSKENIRHEFNKA